MTLHLRTLPCALCAPAFVAAAVLFAGCGGSVAPSGGDEDGGTSSDTGHGGGGDTGTTADSGSGDGGVPPYCGGDEGLTCPSDMWCSYPTGLCHAPDAAGTCRKREALPCPPPTPDDSVCGCDGVTYHSGCEAASAGVSILHLGACDAPPLGCGGSSGATCPPGDYCDFGDGTCPAPGSSGRCIPLPGGCPDIYAPVCGCDGVTYPNACDAHAHGMTIASTGACAIPPGGKSCGGFVGATCDPGEYCDWGVIPSLCGGDDSAGTCKPRPTTCPPIDGIYCGCDGKTYESPCAAAMAGTGVRDNGPCK
jgi:hypothetical protein